MWRHSFNINKRWFIRKALIKTQLYRSKQFYNLQRLYMYETQISTGYDLLEQFLVNYHDCKQDENVGDVNKCTFLGVYRTIRDGL